jgi:hypothetical protein
VAVATLVVPFVSLAGPAPSAHATTVRWASPNGTGTACTEASPCSLDTAVEDPAVVIGDEVVVTPGSYSVLTLEITKAIAVHGQAGQAVPTITTTTGPIGVYVGAAAAMSDLHLVSSVQSSGIYVAVGGATIERVSASVPFAGSTACNIAASVLFRDSVCWAKGTNTKGMGSNVSTFPGTQDIVLRNVTAIGGLAGIGFDVSGPGVIFAVDAKNVIARSAGGANTFDVRAAAAGGASSVITLASSSYATEQELTNGGGMAATVTNPGTGTNQTTAPVFVDAANGDFHEAAGSPTLDGGILDANTGATDFEGDPRSIRGPAGCPALPDIGADERMSSLECDPPETTIDGPSGTTEDATPTFTVTSDEPLSTFECRVDAAAFATCTSPYTTTVLTPGSHAVQARATDPSGNVDATPATRSVTVTVPVTPGTPGAPETTLTQAPAKKVVSRRKRVRVTFAFSSSPGVTFECSLDAASYRACTSPTRAKVGKGKHTFAVRAVSSTGTVDPSPATVTFKVKVKHRG